MLVAGGSGVGKGVNDGIGSGGKTKNSHPQSFPKFQILALTLPDPDPGRPLADFSTSDLYNCQAQINHR